MDGKEEKEERGKEEQKRVEGNKQTARILEDGKYKNRNEKKRSKSQLDVNGGS